MNKPSNSDSSCVPEAKMRDMSLKPDSVQLPVRNMRTAGMPSPFSEGNFNFPPRPSRQNSRNHVPLKLKTTPEALTDSSSADYLSSKAATIRAKSQGGLQPSQLSSPISRPINSSNSQAVSPMTATPSTAIVPANGSSSAASSGTALGSASSGMPLSYADPGIASPRSSAVGQAADMQARILALQRSRSKRTTPQTAMPSPQGTPSTRRTSSSSMNSINITSSWSARTSVSTVDSNWSLDDDQNTTPCSTLGSSSGNEMNEALEDDLGQTMTPTTSSSSAISGSGAALNGNHSSNTAGTTGTSALGSANPSSASASSANVSSANVSSANGSSGSSISNFSPLFSPKASSTAISGMAQTHIDSPIPHAMHKQPLANNGFDPNTVISPTAASAAASGGAISLGRVPSFRSKQRSSLSARRGLKLESMPPATERSVRNSAPALSNEGGSASGGGSLGPGFSQDRASSMTLPLAGPSLAVPNGHNGIPAPKGNRGLFRDYRKYLDIETGSLKFNGKACVHAKGIEFSSGEKFDISMEKLKFICELGSGNYGTVQKVLHTRNGVFMAVKEIRLELDEASLQQIIMELDVLHRCETRSIISFYGAFFVEGSVYICMEYMNGGSINKIYEGGVPEKYLKYIVRAVVAGLKQLKEEFNIIHRDVKPTNILCSTEGTVKLCDFGVSGNLVASMARTNVGCQAYMAPERIKGDRFTAGRDPNQPLTYTAESDIWSLGLSIIEMANGSYPYPSDLYMSIFSQLNAIVEEPSPALDPTKYSPEACDFVDKLLCKRPDQRPKYADIVKHPWLAAVENDCTPEEFGNFVKSRQANQETHSEECGTNPGEDCQTLEHQATVTLQTMAG